MFELVRNNKRLVQGFLALITLPFAFFGMDSYLNSSKMGESVADIGGMKISQSEFQKSLAEQQQRLRAQLGAGFDPKLLDAPEIRQSIVDDLVNQRLLLIEASKQHMFAGDDAVRRSIAEIPAFQVDGKFNSTRYEALLSGQGMTPTGFEAQLRRDLTLQQLGGGVLNSGLQSSKVTERILAMQTEKRHIAEIRLNSSDYLGKVKLAEDAARKFYDENAKQFDLPEQAKVEYVVLSLETLGGQISPSESEIQTWYDGHKSRYQQPEERRASHILIGFDKLGKEKAKSRADELLADLRKQPGSFAELAKKHSDDPGSASKGGDLGFFGRGGMVKAFEDSAFSLKEGETSGVVESEFGYHIIKLTGIRPGKEKPLAEVRAEIEDELRKATAGRKFGEAAEAFTNMVYEQSDSLKPAAEKFKLAVKQSDWIGRQVNPAAGVLANEKLLTALFSEDSVKNKRNTETVEVAPNTLVAAHLVEYKPTTRQPFEAVKSTIDTLLTRKEAQALARSEGESRLASLRKGEDSNQAWVSRPAVSRLEARQLPPQLAKAIFTADVSKLPVYVGAEVPGQGYSLVRISKLEAGAGLEEDKKKALIEQLQRIAAKEDFQAYLLALRSRYKVEINKAAIEAK